MCEDSLGSDIEWNPDPIEPPKPGNGYWITRDGRVMRMSEMTDDHLQNAINLLTRRIESIEGVRAEMLREQYERSVREKGKFRAHLDRVSALVATWPVWKQNILRDSANPHVKVPRKPVENQ